MKDTAAWLALRLLGAGNKVKLADAEAPRPIFKSYFQAVACSYTRILIY